VIDFLLRDSTSHQYDRPGRAGVPRRRQVVAALGLLDLDDLGAELTEERAAEGRGHERGQVEHAEAVQRLGHEAHV
jgi:hypothetical protein